MKDNNLLVYWQYDVNEKEFEQLLNELNIEHCTYLSESPEDANNSNKTAIYLYNSLDYYEQCPIQYELDYGIIKKLYPYERIALDIVNRWRRSYTSKNTYAEIKRMYYVLLRFWNNYILENQINLFILTIIPHIPCTYIPYILCKIYKIPTVVQGVIPFSKQEKINYILKPSIEKMDYHWGKRFLKYKEDYKDADADSIPLKPELERYFKQYDISKKRIDNVIFYNERSNIKETVEKYWARAKIYLNRQDYKVILNKAKYLLITRIETNNFLKKVEKLEEEVDLNKQYYYFALHLQPEATTLPSGGIYAEQILAIRILSKALPENIYLYVKEHPSYWIQKGRLESVYESRSIQFYEEIKRLKNVKLIKHTYSSKTLIEKCQAVVTITGTVGFEALFWGKPALIFGHTFYENYPYAFPIKTIEDCKNAICEIMRKKFSFKRKEMKLYLKSIEKYVVTLGANEKNFKDNGTPGVDQKDRENIVKKITEFVKEYYPSLN